jgi:hypothetical protein
VKKNATICKGKRCCTLPVDRGGNRSEWQFEVICMLVVELFEPAAH